MNNNNWIDVNEDKSAPNGTYLVWCRYRACSEYDVGYCTDDGTWLSEDTGYTIPVIFREVDPLPDGPPALTTKGE